MTLLSKDGSRARRSRPIKGRRFRTFPLGAVALVLLFTLVLALPVTLSVMIKERSDAVAAAEAKLAALDAEITSLENDLEVKNDLGVIRKAAVDEYGMISMDLAPRIISCSGARTG